MSLVLKLGDDVMVRSLQKRNAIVMYELMNANRPHLDGWLRWSSALQTLQDVQRFIAHFEAKEAAGDGFHCGIWVEGELAGGVVCWYINKENRNGEVGYWLGKPFTGRGLATKAARAVMEYLFHEQNLHRVEMQCGVENRASCAVAARCGLRREGIRRESQWITDRFVDHVVYGVLAREWEQNQNSETVSQS